MSVETSDASASRPGLPPEVLNEVMNRLSRAEGQLRGVQRLLAEGADCAKILTQLAAANRAVEQAGFRLVAGGLSWCARQPDAAAAAGYDVEQLEQLFIHIA